MLNCLLYFQPFPREDGGRQATDSRGEYCHAKEQCDRAGVKVPLVGLLTAHGLNLVRPGWFLFGLIVLFVYLFVCVQGTLSRSEWEAASRFFFVFFLQFNLHVHFAILLCQYLGSDLSSVTETGVGTDPHFFFKSRCDTNLVLS